MDSMTVNKGLAAVLTSGIAFFLAGLVGSNLVSPKHLAKPAILIEAPAAPQASAGPAADPPIALLLASADASKGQAQTASQGCVACHSFNQGGKAGIGPNLYGVVGAKHGHMEGYAYSSALLAKQGPWTYDELYTWLKKPAAYAPGTKMTYAGLADPQKRADIIAYLRSLSPNPEPLPPKPAAGTQQASAGTAPPAAPDFHALLASASSDAGKADTAKLGCIACHSFNEGGKAGIGPNLYGVVGGPKGHMEGYAYSAALKGKGGNWSYDELNAWLTKPAAFAPGTKMTFAGIPDAKTRADVVAYLKSISPSAPALPGG